ncbi:MAG: EF-hand domain-containing protein [Paracoccaceae bacterium]
MKKLAYTIALGLVPAGMALAATLAEMDADANGLLSMDELKAAYPDLTDEGFAAIDVNADGSVDADELSAAIEAGTITADG